MAKSKSRKNTATKAFMQAKREAKEKKDDMLYALLIFCAVAIIVIVLEVLALQTLVVPACLLMMIEAGIAVVLHHAELWVHGVLLLAEIIAGIITGKIVLVIMCAVIYVAATIVLNYIYTGEG